MAEVGIGRRVVDADIQTAMGRFDVLEGRVNIIEIADVTGKGFRTAAGLNDRPGHFRTVIDLAAGDNDMSTLLCQQTCGFFTNTTAGAANQGNLPSEIK
jgi:hypothetical protein